MPPVKITHDNYFDAARAVYWYCSDNHEGQGSTKYQILSNLGYTPASSEHGVTDDDESGIIYRGLSADTIDLIDLFNALQEFQHGRND